jgi:hypothetical protein
MPRHEPIEFPHSGCVNRPISFPGENRSSQRFSESSHSLDRMPSPHRVPPTFLETLGVGLPEQSGRLKPSQEGGEIGQQFHGLPVQDGMGVQEVERKVISQKEKPVGSDSILFPQKFLTSI